MKAYIQIAIRTRIHTADWMVGRQLLDLLADNGGLLTPEYVSNNADKITSPFVGIDGSENIWASPIAVRVNGALSEFFEDFAWARKKSIKSSGSVVHTMMNAKGVIVPGEIVIRAACTAKIDWYSVFRLLCAIFPPQIACMHLFDGLEAEAKIKNNSFQIGSFNSSIKPDVPDMGWAMFYGGEFAEAVDVKSISDAGFFVDEISNGYLVRVTECFQDVQDDFLYFSRRRLELKGLFSEGFFLS